MKLCWTNPWNDIPASSLDTFDEGSCSAYIIMNVFEGKCATYQQTFICNVSERLLPTKVVWLSQVNTESSGHLGPEQITNLRLQKDIPANLSQVLGLTANITFDSLTMC